MSEARRLAAENLRARRKEVIANIADTTAIMNLPVFAGLQQLAQSESAKWMASALSNRLIMLRNQLSDYNFSIEREDAREAEMRAAARAQNDNILIMDGVRYEVRPLTQAEKTQSLDDMARADVQPLTESNDNARDNQAGT